MKNYLRMILQLFLVNILSLSIIGCNGRLIGGELHPGMPPDANEKNIAYYQNLIIESNNDIKDCEEWINDVNQALKDGEMTKLEANEEKGYLNAEINFYHAEINEYQYQILLLKGNGKITISEKTEAMIYLSEKIKYLKQELALRTKYPGDDSEAELQAIANKIAKTQTTLEIIRKIEEGD